MREGFIIGLIGYDGFIYWDGIFWIIGAFIKCWLTADFIGFGGLWEFKDCMVALYLSFGA